MKCYNHPERDAVATCSVCGRGLCKECTDKYTPIMCEKCKQEKDESKRAQHNAETQRSLSAFRISVANLVVYSILAFLIGYGMAWAICRFFDSQLEYHVYTYYFCIFLFLPFSLLSASIFKPAFRIAGCIISIIWYATAIALPPLHCIFGIFNISKLIRLSCKKRTVGIVLEILYILAILAFIAFLFFLFIGIRELWFEDKFGPGKFIPFC